MKLKQSLLKDLIYRKEFKKKESKIRSLKILIRLKSLNYLKILNNLGNLKKSTNFSRIKNRCFLTCRSKSVYSGMLISRIKLKELALSGHVLGLKKHSW